MVRLARIVAVNVAKTKNRGGGFFLLLRGILSRRRRRCGRAGLRSRRIILLPDSPLPEPTLSKATLSKSCLPWSGSLGILIRRVHLLVQGIGQVFRWIPDKLEEAVIRGFVVDDDRSLVGLAAHSDYVAADHRSIRDQAGRGCVAGIVRRYGIAARRR